LLSFTDKGAASQLETPVDSSTKDDKEPGSCKLNWPRIGAAGGSGAPTDDAGQFDGQG
jgi:hypothetical protein